MEFPIIVWRDSRPGRTVHLYAWPGALGSQNRPAGRAMGAKVVHGFLKSSEIAQWSRRVVHGFCFSSEIFLESWPNLSSLGACC